MKLVECVLNISEGRRPEIINELASIIRNEPETKLLHSTSGATANRTVFTFAGPLDAVFSAAFRLIQRAVECLDMRTHTGVHPRNGVVDVCPFVPLGTTSMEDCINLANNLGKQVGEQLQVPVFMYENSALSPIRRNLAAIRGGEYEALRHKLTQMEWKPDFGPSHWNETSAKSGSIQIGARDILIAFNINLDTTSKSIATKIARQIRENGGRLPHVKARGWFIEEFNCAQVTINLTNFRKTPMHIVYETVKELAVSLGTRVTGSELIGLVPLEALLQAGRHFTQNDSLSQTDLIVGAIDGMGLSALAEFCPEKRIIEFALGQV